MLHTPDTNRSDPDLAGLSLRCGDQGLEALVIVIEPFPPRSNPRMTLRAGSAKTTSELAVMPSGAALLLPAGPTEALLRAANPEVSLEIDADGRKVQGVIQLTGIDAAVAALACPAK